ncbi:polyamine-modulated factor 1-like [Limulus polyphemus]|uniref:Polyamine-modulated factor 1-like n=1 Tax=Limulus polyphemus TaxID=6850 RepID=A0ABM1BF10_LIMPO|nr:polyamine-modulated factor 1-like [Limulus polyphemus]
MSEARSDEDKSFRGSFLVAADDERGSSTSGDAVSNSSTSDSRLSRLLKTSLDKTISKCMQSFKFQLLCQNFNPIWKQYPEDLKDIHIQLVRQLQENIQLEVDQMYQEEKIIEFLNTLEELKCQQAHLANHHAWRPTGVPDKDIVDHYYPIKTVHRTELLNLVKQLEEENDKLEKQVQVGRQAITNLEKEAKVKYNQYEELAKVCSGLSLEKLENDLHTFVDFEG